MSIWRDDNLALDSFALRQDGVPAVWYLCRLHLYLRKQYYSLKTPNLKFILRPAESFYKFNL